MGKPPVSLSGRPLAIIAHRGCHQREPENTLAAFAEALAVGVDGIELDVRQAACGSLICFHDAYTRRLLGLSGRVASMDLCRLMEFKVRHEMSGRMRPLATLDEVLELLGRRVEVILDLKQEKVRATTLERDTLHALKRHGLRDNVVISSFNPWVLKRFKSMAPRYRTALIAGSRLSARLYNPAYCDGLHLHHSLLTSRWLARTATPSRLVVWTVDSRSDLPHPVPDSVRALITNYPRRFRPGRLA